MIGWNRHSARSLPHWRDTDCDLRLDAQGDDCICTFGFRDLGSSAIRKLPNTDAGRLLAALGEPMTRGIVSRLMVGSATPGELLSYARGEFDASSSAVSDRISQLETLHALNRQRDGTVRLSDDVEPERIVQGAHRWMKRALAAAANVEGDTEARLAEALEKRDAPQGPEVAGVDGAQLTVVESPEYLDDAAARALWERAAAKEPPEPPDVTLRRLVVRERPSCWPAVSWISELEHSRSPGDLVRSPARYLPAPARHLTISSDWQAFSALVNRWALRYQKQVDADFVRWTIGGHLKLLVEEVLASAIVEREQNPKHRGAFGEATLRKIVTPAMPAIDADVEGVLHEIWGPPSSSVPAPGRASPMGGPHRQAGTRVDKTDLRLLQRQRQQPLLVDEDSEMSGEPGS